ncbi:Hypothetical predicted protein [Paramuricea clavata]|uniref:Uncharacterized protein n=1 Tax=Paramuricea clavata TaxID=317549 RepID=A0A7D9J263_PARCT|nr:Hypothetical predicted protein [Paramuricea clavata]
MKQSSSSTSEDDVPLKQRVKTKAQTVIKKAKKDIRKNTVPVQPLNSKKFVIPRNKKTRELLDIQGLESRDAVELLRKVKQSFYQPDNISNYIFENVTIVHNARFSAEVHMSALVFLNFNIEEVTRHFKHFPTNCVKIIPSLLTLV